MTSDGLNASNMLTFDSPWNYTVFGINVTDATTWTPRILLSSVFYVRLYTNVSVPSSKMFYVDYVGLRYNWTLNYTTNPDPVPIWDYPNSTFSGIDFGDFITGGMGFMGFAGMIAVPAITLWRARESDNRMVLGVYGIVGFTICFGLFLASLGL